jgi:hypothetical protein
VEWSEQWWVARNRDWLWAGLGAAALAWLLMPKGDGRGRPVAADRT